MQLPSNKLQSKVFAIFLGFILTAMSTVGLGSDEETTMQKFNIQSLAEENATTELPYLEFLRVESMSAYLYELPAGAQDEQTPHDQDEIYYVVAGQSDFVVDGKTTPIETGDILFVGKFATHAFTNITEDLQLLVVFAPPDTE